MTPVGSLTPPAMPDTSATPAANEAVAPADGDKKKTNEPRDYQIGQRVKGTAEKIKAKVDELIGDGRGEVFIIVGTQSALQPRLAMKQHTKDNDVNGDYETVADRAYTKFPGLESKVESKRTVKGL